MRENNKQIAVFMVYMQISVCRTKMDPVQAVFDVIKKGRNWLVLIGKHRARLRVSRTSSNGHFEPFWSKMVRTVLMCR